MTRDIFNQRSLGKALNSQVKAVREPFWRCPLADDFPCPSSHTLNPVLRVHHNEILSESQSLQDGLLGFSSIQRHFMCLPSQCFMSTRIFRVASN